MLVKVNLKDHEDTANYWSVKNTYVQNGRLLVLEFWKEQIIYQPPGKDGIIIEPIKSIKIPLDDIESIYELDETKLLHKAEREEAKPPRDTASDN